LLLSASFFLLCAPQAVGGGFDDIARIPGPEPDSEFGEAVAAIDDLNGDGVSDIVVGAPGTSGGGCIFVYSGSDFSEIMALKRSSGTVRLGETVASIGDLDGDGLSEIAATDGGARAVWIFSGTGAYLRRINNNEIVSSNSRFWPGSSLHGPGDLNGDQVPDIVLGTRYAASSSKDSIGKVYLISGATFTTYRTWKGAEEVYGYFGSSVSSIADMTGDGVREIVIGAAGEARSGNTLGNGRVYLRSGSDGATLQSWEGSTAIQLGRAVSNAGDVDGDGFEDVLAGAPGYDGSGKFESGAVFVYSSHGGTEIRRYEGGSLDEGMGTFVSSAGDFDGDGSIDHLLASPRFRWVNPAPDPRGRFQVFSGATSKRLYRSVAETADSRGAGVAALPGSPGQMSRVIGGGPTSIHPVTGESLGSIHIVGFSPYIEATAIEGSVAAGVEIDYSINFPDSMAGAEYRVLISTSGTAGFNYGVDIPLTYDNLVQETYNGIHPLAHGQFVGVLDRQGRATARIRSTPGVRGYLIGRSYHLAAIAYTPGGLPEYSSVAVPLTILP